MNSEFALTVIIKSTIVLLAAGSISCLLRKAAASTRHVVWTAGLVSVLLLPILSLQLPTLELRVLPPIAQTAVPWPPPVFPTPRPDIVSASTTASSTIALPAHAQWTAAQILFFSWLAGAALVGVRSAVGYLMIRRLVKRPAARLVPERESISKELIRTFALQRPVAVRLSDESVTPMTMGLRSSTILLPAEANNWSEERLRFVLAHELAHVKRRDTLMQVPIQIACSLHWFNPLVWLAHRRFLIERERACDDFVINSGAQPDVYADHLLNIARSVRHKPRFAFSGIFMANRSQLETRLLSILDKNMNRKSPNRIVLAVTIMTVVTLLIPLATVQLRAQQSKQPAQIAAPAPLPALPAQRPPQEKRFIISDEEKAAFEKLKSEQDRERFIEDAARQYQDQIQDQSDAIEQAVRNYREAMKKSQFDRDQFDFNSAELGRQAELLKERLLEMGLDNKSERLATYDAYLQALGMRANREHLDQAVGPLTEALQDSNVEVRRAAAHALGELRDQRAVAPLLKALADQDAEVRQSAIQALGEIRDTAAVSALIQAVKDPNPGVRQHAILALANIRSTDALDAILTAMKDTDPAVRKAAVEALAEIVKQ